MNLRLGEKLRQAPRWLKTKFASGGIILLYHRVTELPSDPYLLSVTPQRFAEHLEVLRKVGHPMSLQELVRLIREGKRPRRAVVVTFDDGYADNLHEAKPLLERYDIPATVFVTTGQIEREREFWWDELDRLLLQAGALPETLKLEVQGSNHQWELGAAAHYSNDEYLRHRDWNVVQTYPSSRQHVFLSLHQLLRPLPESERSRVLGELLKFTGAEPTVRSTHRSLTSSEVIDLADGGLIEVGAHTVTHTALAPLPLATQRDEIRRSKERLEEILGRPVNSFAYPFGAQSDYTAETIAAVREAGFTCACSNFVGIVERDTDLFELPRVMVGHPALAAGAWDGETLARVMRHILASS